MKLRLGFSPCPNDTFIFDALVNKKIDTGDLEFDVFMEDVETLNQWALEDRLDITKISFGVLPLLLRHYSVLNTGSALGKGVGPLLIRNPHSNYSITEEALVALPGEHTTAHMLYSLAYPDAKNKCFLRYDQIEDFVSADKGWGVIIHENRFTYMQKGLEKVQDLGEFWERKTGFPIPLGGIVAKNSLEVHVKNKVSDLIRKSIEFADRKFPELSPYIKMHSQSMSEEVMRKHITLYVNDYSKDIGMEGKNAIIKLIEVYNGLHNSQVIPNDVFAQDNISQE